MSFPIVVVTGKVVAFKSGVSATTQRQYTFVDILAPKETAHVRVFQVPEYFKGFKGSNVSFAAIVGVRDGKLNFRYESAVDFADGEIVLNEEKETVPSSSLEATV